MLLHNGQRLSAGGTSLSPHSVSSLEEKGGSATTSTATPDISRAGKPCDQCPFRLLRENAGHGNSESCVDCSGVTKAELARYEALVWRCLGNADSGNPQRIEEALSEAVLAIGSCHIADRYDDRIAPPANLVAGVVKNTCLNLRRRVRPHASLDDRFDIPAESPQPSDEAFADEVQTIVRSKIGELPPRYRVAICGEYGIPDPCDPSGRIPEQLERRNDMVLFRARRRLRDLIHAKYPSADSLF